MPARHRNADPHHLQASAAPRVGHAFEHGRDGVLDVLRFAVKTGHGQWLCGVHGGNQFATVVAGYVDDNMLRVVRARRQHRSRSFTVHNEFADAQTDRVIDGATSCAVAVKDHTRWRYARCQRERNALW
ncbi:MAG: hypothetical protein WAM92_09815 [Mycobacterium sp.]